MLLLLRAASQKNFVRVLAEKAHMHATVNKYKGVWLSGHLRIKKKKNFLF